MTPAARAIFLAGFEEAVRLGHRHLGCEHLLLALAESGHPVAAALRAHGLVPDLVRDQLAQVAADELFGDLDASSLTAIGIDFDAVRERAGELRAGGAEPGGAVGAGRARPRPGRAADGDRGNRGAARGVGSGMA